MDKAYLAYQWITCCHHRFIIIMKSLDKIRRQYVAGRFADDLRRGELNSSRVRCVAGDESPITIYNKDIIRHIID
jgi:hypothetical protein